MNATQLWSRSVCKVLVGIGIAWPIWTAQGHAQVVASFWNGSGDFIYDIHSMPDLDQRRSGLDNDGNMHCVPTAVMNLLAFTANFAEPEMPPYPGVWIGVPGHNAMTGWIDWLGQYMGTSGDSGTSGTGKIEGLEDWIEDSGSPIVFGALYSTEDFWPTIDTAAWYATTGAIVQFSYGRYEWEPGFQGTPRLVDRAGGHAVTLKLAYADNNDLLGPRLIHYRDPGSDDGDLDSNSNFSSAWPETAANIDIQFDATGNGSSEYFTVTSLTNPPPEDNRYRILDSILAIYPPGGIVVGGNVVSGVFAGGKLGFVQDQSPVPYSPPTNQTVIAAIAHPELHSALLIQGIAGQSANLVQATHHGRTYPIAKLAPQTTCLANGFGSEVYVAAGRSISRIRLEGTSRVVPVRFATAPAAVETMYYDDTTDRLLVTYGRTAAILQIANGRWTILGPCSGVAAGERPIKNVSISRGVVYASLQNGTVVAAALPKRAIPGQPLKFSAVSLPGVSQAIQVDLDGMHRMFVSDAVRGLLEFELSGGSWAPAENSYVADLVPIGAKFVAFRNRCNIRTESLDESKWYDIDPRELLPLGPEIPD